MTRLPAAWRLLSPALLFAMLCGVALRCEAAVPSTVPQFRIDGTMHTAAIGQIRADGPRQRVVTLAADRTVRIWQLPSLRLVRVLRLPQEGHIEGMPMGLAISPDGRTIAVGGWTGIEWEKKASIYLFDSVSGRMVQRVGAFADVVSALDWSPDGSKLAVGLGGRHGVRVLSTRDWRVIAEDADYSGSVTFVHFSSAGWLAASASDGAVRLYDAALALATRQAVGVSQWLGGVRFSPDGKLLALGIVDKPMALLLTVPNLDLAVPPLRVSDAQQTGMCCIAWSRDGGALYINGDHAGDGPNPIYRFGESGRGPGRSLPVGDQRISNMLPLDDGSLLFATTAPSLTLLSARGDVLRSVATSIGDFRRAHGKLMLSADAGAVSLPMGRGDGTARLFSVTGLDQPPDIDTRFAPPLLEASNFRLEHFTPDPAPGAHGEPTINGTRVPVAEGDAVEAFAFAHDQQAVFAGTRWQLLKADRKAKVLWRKSFSSEVRAVNAAADGRHLVIALADGTLRWLQQSDGTEVLAYFPHLNGRDWVAWRPDGYYASSEEGDQQVGWHVNRGLDREPDFYRAVQFERIFYRPDLLRAALAPSPARRNNELALELEPIAPARIAVQDTRTRLNAKGRVEISVALSAEARRLPMKQLAVFVNGIPVTPVDQRQLSAGETTRFERTLVVESDDARNDVRIEIDHGQSMGLLETYAEFTGPVPKRPAARGRLFVLAIGINQFTRMPERRKATFELGYAAQDAQAFAKAMQQASSGLFRETHVTVLTDGTERKPERAQILSALSQLSQAGPDDTTVVFLASHGFSDEAGNYYFLPQDGEFDDVFAVVKNRNQTGKAPSLLGWEDFFDAMRNASGRRSLIVDTCHARRIEGTTDTHSLRKRSAASSVALLAAASGNEPSQEYEPAGHGLFTYALLESLKPVADKNTDGMISLSEAFDHLGPMVLKLHDERAGSQTPELIGPSSLLAQTIARVLP